MLVKAATGNEQLHQLLSNGASPSCSEAMSGETRPEAIDTLGDQQVAVIHTTGVNKSTINVKCN